MSVAFALAGDVHAQDTPSTFREVERPTRPCGEIETLLGDADPMPMKCVCPAGEPDQCWTYAGEQSAHGNWLEAGAAYAYFGLQYPDDSRAAMSDQFAAQVLEWHLSPPSSMHISGRASGDDDTQLHQPIPIVARHPYARELISTEPTFVGGLTMQTALAYNFGLDALRATMAQSPNALPVAGLSLVALFAPVIDPDQFSSADARLITAATIWSGPLTQSVVCTDTRGRFCSLEPGPDPLAFWSYGRSLGVAGATVYALVDDDLTENDVGRLFQPIYLAYLMGVPSGVHEGWDEDGQRTDDLLLLGGAAVGSALMASGYPTNVQALRHADWFAFGSLVIGLIANAEELDATRYGLVPVATALGYWHGLNHTRPHRRWFELELTPTVYASDGARGVALVGQF